MDMTFATFIGLPGRSNQVLYFCPSKPVQHVIYFQGDIQDLRKNMEGRYEEISQWKDFSLEDTCFLLQRKFPCAAVWLIRPSNVLRDIFGCFHNFVKCSIVGTPDYSTTHGALPHLHLLLRAFSSQVVRHRTNGVELSEEELLRLPITLVGFSKGCVVLNQILHELCTYVGDWKSNPNKGSAGNPLPPPPPPPAFTFALATALSSQTGNKEGISQFLKQVSHIYWLDSGHSGEGEAWITDKETLSFLSQLQIQVHVHVSPQQICCPSRPWIGEEERLFVSTLREMGVTVHETVHFKDEPRSLLNHFRILNEF